MNGYEIRKYNPEFKKPVLDIQKYHWGSHIRLNKAYLEWKYDRNPNKKGTSIYVAMRNGQVVGMLGMCGAKWEFGEKRQTFLAPFPADVVVVPEHRRKGLFKQMMAAHLKDLMDQGVQYAFALSAGTLSYGALVQMGWRTIGEVQTMSRLGPSNMQKIARSLGIFGFSQQTRAYADFDREVAKSHANGYVRMQKKPCPEAMAELVARIASNGRIRHVRDAEYFAWRFRNPFSRYRFLFWQDKTLEGYLILQTSYYNPRYSASIVDWEASSSSVKADLLQSVNVLASGIQLMIWASTVGKEEQSLLRQVGFFPIERSETNLDCPVLIRPVAEPLREKDWFLGNHSILDSSNWDLRWLYSDHCG